MPVMQRMRSYIACDKFVRRHDCVSRRMLIQELYHQSRRAGLFLVYRPRLSLAGGVPFQPTFAYIDESLEIYCLGYCPPAQLKYGENYHRLTRSKFSRTFNSTGYPWFMVMRVNEIPDLVRFAAEARFQRDIGEVRDFNSDPAARIAGDKKLAEFKGRSKGESTAVRQGAFVKETGIRGFGKFR